MAFKCYVGNLSWNTTDDGLREAFAEYGQIVDTIVMRDRDTGRSRGFEFVSFSTEQSMTNAIEGKNDTELDGRRIRVNASHPYGGGVGGGGGYGPYGGGEGGYGGGEGA